MRPQRNIEYIDRVIAELERHGDNIRLDWPWVREISFCQYQPGDMAENMHPAEVLMAAVDEGIRLEEIELFEEMKQEVGPKTLRGYVIQEASYQVARRLRIDTGSQNIGAGLLMLGAMGSDLDYALQRVFFDVDINSDEEIRGEIYINGWRRFRDEGYESIAWMLDTEIIQEMIVERLASIQLSEQSGGKCDARELARHLQAVEPTMYSLLYIFGQLQSVLDAGVIAWEKKRKENGQ